MTDYTSLSDADLLSQYKAAKGTSTPTDFAEAYGPAATRAAQKLGVDPSLLLGQWGLETGWGKSIIPGTHNLGNIKDFSGGGTAATDNMTGSRDKYRAYASPDAFADDYAGLISRKYPGAVGAKTPEQFAAALKAGGYAEDPNYTTKVVKASQMAQPKGMIQRAVEAVIPSANAAETNAFAGMSDADLLAAYQQAKGEPAKAEAASKRDRTTAEKIIAAAGYANPAGLALQGITEGNFSIGAARGLKDVVDTGAELLARGYDKVAGGGPRVSDLVTGQPSGEAARVAAMNQQGKQDFADTYGDSTGAGMGRVAGNVVATLPVGGVLGSGARAVGLNRLAAALASGGATTGAQVAPGVLPAAGNMLLRMAGGAATGAAGAGLIDPNATTTGAVVGAVLPPALAGVKAVANTAGSLVRPFTGSGQNRIVGDTLREFATDPAAARSAMQTTTAVVPGSAPTAATASGDAGIAALTRSMQNASPEFAAEMAARQTAQNQARTASLESIAGNTGKIDLAKAAREASTGPMREKVLDAAGDVPTQSILESIDGLIANPNNAGQLSQQALNQFRNRIAQFSQDGAINARALYAIRKDINDVLGGKLQGEAGNIRYASGQLSQVKSLIDDAIEQASRATTSSASTALSVPGSAVGQAGPATSASSAAPTWRGYLQSYTQQSIPIRQMEQLEKVLTKVKSDAAASDGELFLSATKMNSLLKNKDAPLLQGLSESQMQILRNIQADLNAGQIAGNVGRAVGSNTVQNLAQNQLLQSALGRTLGGSTSASTTLGRLLQIPYGTANKQIQERLSSALMNPQEAAALLADPKNSALLQALTQTGLPYKAVPAISAR